MPGSEDAFELAVVGDGFGPGSLMIMDHCEQLPFLDLFPQIHFHLQQSVRFTSYVTSLVRHIQVDTGTQLRRSLENTCMDQKITDSAFAMRTVSAVAVPFPPSSVVMKTFPIASAAVSYIPTESISKSIML